MKKWVGILFLFLVAFVVIFFYAYHSKPNLGNIRITEMSETTSDSGSDTNYGLKIGSGLLGWSIRGNSSDIRDGYIYMKNPHPYAGNIPVWEFAISQKSQLKEITLDDLSCEFYGMNDPKGTNVFGAAWGGSTIIVPEGQIFFARLVTNRLVTYVVKLAKQGGTSSLGTMRAEYITVTNGH